MGLFSSENSFLGIDIGGSSLKLVELKKDSNGKIALSTYGFTENIGEINYDRKSDIKYLAKLINKIQQRAGTSTINAVASLPTFSVFSSIISLSGVNRKNIVDNINEKAKKVIPLPLEEMVLDWKIIETKQIANNKNDVKVFLTGSPKKLVKKYISIFKEANINLLSLETETFSLVRSLVGNDKSNMMILEIGANSTDISIVKNGIPVLNRSIDICGTTITKAIAEKLNISFKRAEQFKCDLGVESLSDEEHSLPKVVKEAVRPIVHEVEYMMDLFQNNYNEQLEKIILSGGGSFLINFSDYLSHSLNIKVIIGDPWSRVVYPEDLKPVLLEVGPKLSVAIGLAMRGLE